MYQNLAKVVLLILVVISIFAGWSASRIGFDYDFEKFFPVGDADLEYYLNYRQQFENDNDYLLIGLTRQQGIFHLDFLRDVDTLTRAIQKLPQVESVTSPTNLKEALYSPLGWLPVSVLHLDSAERIAQDSARLFEQQKYLGAYFTPDGQSLAIIIKHRQNIKKAAADSLLSSINQLVLDGDFKEVHLAGKARAQPVYLQKIEREMVVFLSASLVLVILFLAIIYRAVWAVVIPLAVVALSGIWILGLMQALDKPLDIMMVLLPTIIFVVGMSDVVHILTRYIEELRQGRAKMKALTTSFKEVGLATFLTSLTTGVGFLTLMTSGIRPIKDFGLYTAIGVLIAYVLAFSLLPAVLVFMKKPQIAQNIRQRRRWHSIMGSCMMWSLRNPAKVLFTILAIIGLSYWGIQSLKTNTYLIDDLPKADPLRADFIYFDEQFGGSRPFEMAVLVRDSTASVWDHQVLAEMAKVEAYLQDTYKTSTLLSPLSIVRQTWQGLNGGSMEYAGKLPNASQLASMKRHLNKITKLSQVNNLVSADQMTTRLSGRMADIGSHISLQKNQALSEFIDQNINKDLVEFRVTGTSLLIDKNTEYLVDNMIYGLAIAFAVVALIAGLMFRSLRMILITLIPNVIPLLMVAGIMGHLDITLKLTTSVVFTVAFGIAVDDTIHFISKFKLEMDKGRSLLYGLKRTYFSTGKAIVITTLILISGFLTLLLSSFGGTFYIGLFVGLTLLFALLIDLTLLPLLILMFYKR